MKYNKKVLDNGLRVITIPEENSLAVTVLVLVEAGSKYESKDMSGVSHFLEHMCFKGTKNRPKAILISGELDSIGAQYNAFTGHELTGYYAKVAPNHFEKAIDIVSDLYLNPLFDENEIEKEKGVICEEINMYEDLPQHKVQDLIMQALYGEQPAGRSIAGEKENVKKLTKDDIYGYREEHYVPSATTVVVAGNFKEEDALKSIKDKFSSMKMGKKSGKVPVSDEQKIPGMVLKDKSSDQTHLVLAFRSFDAKDERNYAIDVLSQVMGGSMSSRLFQRIREDMGAAYYIRSGNNYFTDHGFFEASAGADNTRAEDVIRAILEEAVKLKKEYISEEELSRGKESIIGNLFLGLETSDSLANFYGSHELIRGEIITPEEYAEKIRKVTKEDIRNVANDIFREDGLNLALIGPMGDRENFVKILKL